MALVLVLCGGPWLASSAAPTSGTGHKAPRQPTVDTPVPTPPFRVPARTRQLVVAIAATWESSTATMSRFERHPSGWRQVGTSWPAQLAPAGMAWGRGLHPVPTGVTPKREGDDRAPAGVFRLGTAFGYDPTWARSTKLDYVTVGTRDLFVEDPSSPLYNRHVRLDHEPSTPWERKHLMKQQDPAHALKVLVEHNAAPVVPGAGSAIFVHIFRSNAEGRISSTSGCTAISSANVQALLRWLDPAQQPLYVLLPRAEYDERQPGWGLPAVGE